MIRVSPRASPFADSSEYSDYPRFFVVRSKQAHFFWGRAINYAGSTDENRLIALNTAAASGLSDRMKAFVDTCMAEYDLNGWTAPDLINNTDVSYLLAQLNK